MTDATALNQERLGVPVLKWAALVLLFPCPVSLTSGSERSGDDTRRMSPVTVGCSLGDGARIALATALMM